MYTTVPWSSYNPSLLHTHTYTEYLHTCANILGESQWMRLERGKEDRDE